MKTFILASLLLFLAACASTEGKIAWRVRDMALAPTQMVALQAPNRKIVATLSTLKMKKLLLAHFRIARAAGVQAELVIVDGTDPNAFVGLMNQRYTFVINVAMLKLIGDDIDEFAALLGHEAAHLAKGHAEASKTRDSTLEGIGSLFAVGLGMAGVPAGGVISGLGVDLIDASYSRDEEREADAFGVDYVISAGYDPQGAIRLHEKMLKASGGSILPFLSSHPSGEERIENVKALIQAKKTEQ